jgi:hypothetical protein
VGARIETRICSSAPKVRFAPARQGNTSERAARQPIAASDELLPIVRARLTAPAGRALLETLRDANDGRECGGLLLGDLERGLATIFDLSGPLASDERGPHHMRLNGARGERLADAYRRLGDEINILGDWHLHVRSGSAEASETDRAAWRSRVETQGGGWIGLIVCGNRFRCWLTTADAGRVVTRRLPVSAAPIASYVLAPNFGDRGLRRWQLPNRLNP